MSAEFYAYVRGASDVVPAGYSEAGLKAYRHLVFLGASQMIAASLPELRAQLDDAHWDFLLRDFIRQSAQACR
jgi:hypothetical protein